MSEIESRVTDAVRSLRVAVSDVERWRDARDGAIRAALADGVPYRELGKWTGLTRAALDKIRRAVNVSRPA